MIRIPIENPSIGSFGGIILELQVLVKAYNGTWVTHTSFRCSWTWPIWNQISSSVNGLGGFWTIYLKHFCDELATARIEGKLEIYLQTLVVFLLLLIYYSETKVNLIRLLEVWLHVHDLREGLFGMFKRAVAVIQDANSVPQFGFLSMVSQYKRSITEYLPWGL